MTFDLPDLPKTSTDPTVKEFLAKYYGISNQAESHDDYTDLFSFDREFAMNDKSAKGRQHIHALRKVIWAHVPGCDHSPMQIYTHGGDQMDLMVHRDVNYPPCGTLERRR